MTTGVSASTTTVEIAQIASALLSWLGLTLLIQVEFSISTLNVLVAVFATEQPASAVASMDTKARLASALLAPTIAPATELASILKT